MAALVEVIVLDGFSARRRDGTSVVVTGTGAQAVLALLAISAPHAVSVDRLVDELWGEGQPRNPGNALQARMSQLRRLLGRDAIVRRGGGYVLGVDAADVDAQALERLVRDARQAMDGGDAEKARDRADAALALVGKHPLGELVDLPFAAVALVRVEELVLAASEVLADARLALGRDGEAVRALIGLVERYPMRERFAAQLALGLYRSGRQSDALVAVRDARQRLLDELGLDPGPELAGLERRILAHDPTLAIVGGSTPELPQVAALPAGRDLASWDPVDVASGPSRLVLVGRSEELAALEESVVRAAAGDGHVVVVSGEPGIGKTRLVEELASRARRVGAVVAWGRSDERRATRELWPWARIVRDLHAELGDDIVRAGLGDRSQVLAPLVPELAGPEPDGPSAAWGSDPVAARARLFEAVVVLLERAAASRPVVVVLDDIHWADRSTLDLLAISAAELERARVLLVVIQRLVDPDTGTDLHEVLAGLARGRGALRLELGGLGEAAVAELVASRGLAASEELATALHRRTGGNPFFLTEVLRLPALSGRPSAAAVGHSVPAGVGQVVRQRIGRLPVETASALAFAAIAGDELDVPLLAAALDVTPLEALEVLEPALMAGLLLHRTERSPSLRFAHGLVRETLTEDLGAARFARAHARLAQALEVRHGDHAGPHLLAMAAHWADAWPAAPAEHAVDVAVRAAAWAQQHLAIHQAQALLRRALDLVTAVADPRERAQHELVVLGQLIEAVVVVGGYADPAVDAMAGRMVELCAVVDGLEVVVPAVWRLAMLRMGRADFDGSADLAAGLIERSDRAADGAEAELVGRLLLGMIHLHQGRAASARRHLDRALALVDEGNAVALTRFAPQGPVVLLRTMSACSHWLLAEEAAARSDIDIARNLAADTGPQSFAAAYATQLAAVVAALHGDVEETHALSVLGLDLADAGGFGSSHPALEVTLGWADTISGRLPADEGLAAIADAIAGNEALGAQVFISLYHGLRADAAVRVGRPEQALESVAAGLRTVETWYDAELRRLEGEALQLLDPHDRAGIEALEHAVELASEQGAVVLLTRAAASLHRAAG